VRGQETSFVVSSVVLENGCFSLVNGHDAFRLMDGNSCCVWSCGVVMARLSDEDATAWGGRTLASRDQ